VYVSQMAEGCGRILCRLDAEDADATFTWGNGKMGFEMGVFNNWHTSINEAHLQFALFTDDVVEVNACYARYREIFSSYVKDSGLTGESFRDSDHCCFGLAGLIQTCELAWHQGVDLYSMRDGLLRKSIELHAGVYSGREIPAGCKREDFKIVPWIQPSEWEIARNHYIVRCKMEMPHTEKLLVKIRPCKYALHWGWDSLTHGP
jgi:hypothetical protein